MTQAERIATCPELARRIRQHMQDSRIFGQMETAARAPLIALAEDPGETKAAQACRQNLQAKTAMAEWLIGHLPWTIRAFPNRAAAGDPSARR